MKRFEECPTWPTCCTAEVPCQMPLPDEPETEPCAYVTRRATYDDPAEHCEEETLEGSEFCGAHDPQAIADRRIDLEEDYRRENGW